MTMDPDDDAIIPPNGGAYEKRETRNGPPLGYVGEKLGMAVIAAHSVLRLIESDEATAQLRAYEPGSSAFQSFHSATTAFLALYNMLGLIDDQHKFDLLQKLGPDEFREWVERVQRVGSVRG